MSFSRYSQSTGGGGGGAGGAGGGGGAGSFSPPSPVVSRVVVDNGVVVSWVSSPPLEK